jgi:TonB family protein
MKYWIQILKDGHIQSSHLWNSEKPFYTRGSRRLVIDKQNNSFVFMDIQSTGQFQQVTHPAVDVSAEGEVYDVLGRKIRLVPIPKSSPVLQSDVEAYKGRTIEVPTLARVDFDELQFMKISKYTFISGISAMLMLFLSTAVMDRMDEGRPEKELLAEKKLVPVKLKNAPTPAVIAAAYERAMQQGALQAKKLNDSAPKNPGPKSSPVSNLKNAFASLMGGALQSVASRAVAPKMGAEEAAALLPGVQGSGVMGRAGQRGGGSKGDSLVQVAMSGSGDGGYAVGGDAAGVGLDGVEGQGNAWLSLNLTDALVDEGLSRDEVGRVIHSRISEIRYCYESSMLRKPDLEGKLIIDFTIAGSGRVRSANVKESSVRDERLNECILKRLARWEFPKPKSGVEVAVSYPFIFKRLRR